MQLDDNLLQKLEHLSALKIPENERENCINALSEVLEFANILNELDTSNITRCDDEFSPLREDEPIHSKIAAQVLEHAPARSEQYFCVPKIIE